MIRLVMCHRANTSTTSDWGLRWKSIAKGKPNILNLNVVQGRIGPSVNR